MYIQASYKQNPSFSRRSAITAPMWKCRTAILPQTKNTGSLESSWQLEVSMLSVFGILLLLIMGWDGFIGSRGQDRLVPLQIQLCSSFEQIFLLVVPKGNTLSNWRYSIIPHPKPSFIVMLLVVTIQGSFLTKPINALWTMKILQIPQNDHRLASSPPKCCYRSWWVPLNPPRNTPFVSRPRDMPHHSRRA